MTSDCTTIYLVRHAHADWEPNETRPLSKRGRVDAKAVGHILEQFPIDAIYASPYRRAYETVEPLAHALGLEIKIEPDLRERALGRIQPEMFVAAVKKTWDDPMFSHPGGETNLAAQKRGLAVLNRVRRTPGQSQIVLSTHGVMMALLLQSFDSSISFAFWESLSMPDIYAVEFCNGDRIQIRRMWGCVPIFGKTSGRWRQTLHFDNNSVATSRSSIAFANYLGRTQDMARECNIRQIGLY